MKRFRMISVEVLTLVALFMCTSANAVTLVQTGDGRVWATVPLGLNPTPWAVAVNPNNGIAVVVDPDSNTVSLVQTGDGTVVATVPVGRTPIAVAVNPNNDVAVAADIQDQPQRVFAYR